MNPQEWASIGLSWLVNSLPVGYAFGAGMIASVNPCGFAMLPVYLTMFLEDQEGDTAQETAQSAPQDATSTWKKRYGRALLVGGSVTLGVVVLFGLAGLLLSGMGQLLMAWAPRLALAVGVVLLLLGVYLLVGGKGGGFSVFQRLAAKLGDPRRKGLGYYMLFGLGYGISSLSCTFPVFALVVGGALTADGFWVGMLQFVAYALGMGSVLLAVTLAVAGAKQGLSMQRLMRWQPVLHRLTAVLLVLAGSYIVYYWGVVGQLLA